MATRTTHPRSLRLIDHLHQLVLPEAASIRNPYAALTKTEVVQRIAQHGGKEMIKHSVSCTHVRDQDTLRTHCAACSQCLDRRFAILAAALEDAEPAEMYRFDVLAGARDDDRSRTLAVDWTRHAREIAGMDPMSFLSRFGQDIARVVDGHAGADAHDIQRRMYDLHRRHASSVVSVLAEAFRTHAGDLARQTLPPTSLLAQHVGATPISLAMPFASPAPLIPLDEPFADAAPDLPVGPSLPLRVAFFQDEKGSGIDIQDVTTIRGQPARVVHVLREPLDEDRAAGLPEEQHRFVEGGTIAKTMGNTKEKVRQDVNRCRKQLRTEWRAITEEPLPHDALIQSGRKGGYRLAPDTITFDR